MFFMQKNVYKASDVKGLKGKIIIASAKCSYAAKLPVILERKILQE